MEKIADSESMVMRSAKTEDAEEILAIYGPYVKKTAITFEYDIPTLQDFKERIENTLTRYPYLVATCNGVIIGYAYAGPFHPRAAYQHSAELSIYLSPASRGQGLGKKLYSALERILLSQHVYNLEACITWAGENDPYVPRTSPLFHEHLGFRLVGRFSKCGYKFGQWYDMVWMEKLIGNRPEHPEPFIPYSELGKK